MKLISIFDTYFKLPDDFSGSYSDALRLLADYLEGPAQSLTDKLPGVTKDGPWAAYEETLAAGGKVCGTFGLKYFDGTEWKDID